MNETNQKLVRRASVLVLYAIDVAEQADSDALGTIRSTLRDEYGGVIDDVWADVTVAVEGVRDRLVELNGEIQQVSPRWKVDRMAPVDRTLLRVGTWEILYAKHSPLHVINATVDLAKEYGEKSTPAFVNGLLDQLCKNHKISVV